MPNTNMTQPSTEELLAQIKALKAQNEALAKKAPAGVTPSVTFKSSTPLGAMDSTGAPGKGTVSAYGLGRRPITGYANQWARIFKDSHKLAQYIVENAEVLGFKSDEQRAETVKFFTRILPVLQGINSKVQLGADEG